MHAGFDPALFWSLSPREINNIMRGAKARALHDHNDRAWLAWTTANLSRADKLPDLGKLLIRDKPQPSRRMSWQDMLAVVKGNHAIRENRKQ